MMKWKTSSRDLCIKASSFGNSMARLQSFGAKVWPFEEPIISSQSIPKPRLASFHLEKIRFLGWQLLLHLLLSENFFRNCSSLCDPGLIMIMPSPWADGESVEMHGGLAGWSSSLVLLCSKPCDFVSRRHTQQAKPTTSMSMNKKNVRTDWCKVYLCATSKAKRQNISPPITAIAEEPTIVSTGIASLAPLKRNARSWEGSFKNQKNRWRSTKKWLGPGMI